MYIYLPAICSLSMCVHSAVHCAHLHLHAPAGTSLRSLPHRDNAANRHSANYMHLQRCRRLHLFITPTEISFVALSSHCNLILRLLNPRPAIAANSRPRDLASRSLQRTVQAPHSAVVVGKPLCSIRKSQNPLHRGHYPWHKAV